MLEIHPKVLVMDLFILLPGAYVPQGPLGDGDCYEGGKWALKSDVRLSGRNEC